MNVLAFHDFDCMTLANHQVESVKFNGKMNQESKKESGGIYLSPAFDYPLDGSKKKVKCELAIFQCNYQALNPNKSKILLHMLVVVHLSIYQLPM